MKQLIEIQSWTFQSISGEKKTRQEKQIISKILHSPAPVPISSCYSGCGQAIKWGSNTMGILICIFQIKGLSPHKFEGKAVCIHLSLSAQILKHFWYHVCIMPMQRYRRGSPKSLLSCYYTAFALTADLFGVILEILCTPQEESSTCSGGEGWEGVRFP